MDRSRVTRRPSSLRFSATEVIIAQLLGVTGGVVASLCGLVWWGAVALAVLLVVAALVRVGGWSSLDWARTYWRYCTEPGRTESRTVGFQAPTGQSVGLRWDGGNVVAVAGSGPTSLSYTSVAGVPAAAR